MKKLIIVFGILCLSGIAVMAQTFSNYEYEYSDSIFNNPERGFYKYTERNNANTTLDLNTLTNYRDLGYTLIYRIFYLRDFVNSPISASYLAKIKDDFNKMREAGIKGIIRFAYTSSMAAPYGDASPAIVSSHIEQLKPILTDNSDVIFILQAGFIGAWGEWYYTDYFATGSPGNVTDEDLDERKELVYELLDAIPEDRMIQLRYVGYKMSLFDSIPLTFKEAYSGTPKSRISHHNDCFVSSENDVGSYKNITLEKEYLEQDTKYTSVGGETCDWYPSRSNCGTSTTEMERFHWSFINQDYYGPTLNEWEESGCYSEMFKKIGYRYYLIEAEIQDSTKQNGLFSIRFKMENVGYSNPVNPRNLEIVIRNKENGKLYFARIDTEIRKQELNTIFEYSGEFGIPSFISDGEYEVYLNLPDPRATLRFDTKYSIRLASKNSWNSNIGMNFFNHTLHINKNAHAGKYNGDNYFSDYSQTSDSIDSPKLDLTAYCQNVIVSIAPEEKDTSSLIIVEHSTSPDDGYSPVASLAGKANTIFFEDNGLSQNTIYYYRAKRITGNNYSEYSNPQSILTGDCQYKYPAIITDANDDDWNAISPVNAIAQQGLNFFFKAYTDNTNLNLLLKGDSVVAPVVYIDTDNNSFTGENNQNWKTSGFEFKYSQGNLYQYETGGYVKIATIDSVKENGYVWEIKIPLAVLDIGSSNTVINFAEQVEISDYNFFIPFQHRESSLYERVMPPVKPQNIAGRNSVNSPSSKLIITWDKCSDCDGYVLTRIEKTNNIITNIDLQVEENQLADDNLMADTPYEYFVYSYNFGGKSEESEHVILSTSTTTGINNEIVDKRDISTWPIPATDNLYVKLSGVDDEKKIEFKIYTMEGKVLCKKELDFNYSTNTRIITIPVQNLKAGLYLLKVYTGKESLVQKFIKE